MEMYSHGALMARYSRISPGTADMESDEMKVVHNPQRAAVAIDIAISSQGSCGAVRPAKAC